MRTRLFIDAGWKSEAGRRSHDSALQLGDKSCFCGNIVYMLCKDMVYNFDRKMGCCNLTAAPQKYLIQRFQAATARRLADSARESDQMNSRTEWMPSPKVPKLSSVGIPASVV